MFHIEPLKLWVHKVLPVVYDDSLSYYEVLAKVTKKLNEVIDLTDEQTQYIETFTGNLTEAIQNWETGIESEWSNYKRDLNTEWQSFITSTEQYLKNWTNMQESEIEDAIAAGITQFATYFADLTQTAVDAVAAAEAAAENAAEDAVEAVLPTLEDTFDERYAWRTAVGSPLVASSAAGMTDTDKIYVYVGSETGYVNGDWYYYDGTAWQDGGVYNSAAIVTDPTLSEAGMPADAKAAGDEIADLKSAFTSLAVDGEYLPIPKSAFARGTVLDGTYNPNVQYRVSTPDLVEFVDATTIYVNSGFLLKIYVYNGSTYGSAIDVTSSYDISANTQCKLVIRRTTEDTTEVADVDYFVSQINTSNKLNDITQIKNDVTAIKGNVSSRSGINDISVCTGGISGDNLIRFATNPVVNGGGIIDTIVYKSNYAKSIDFVIGEIVDTNRIKIIDKITCAVTSGTNTLVNGVDFTNNTVIGTNYVIGYRCYNTGANTNGYYGGSEGSYVSDLYYTDVPSNGSVLDFNSKTYGIGLYMTIKTYSIPELTAQLGEIESGINVGENMPWEYAIDNVICIGDSLTSGSPADSSTMPYPLEQNYPWYLSRMLGAECTNTGVPGIATKGWYTDEYSKYTMSDYNTFIIFLGTNGGLTNTLATDVDPYDDYHNYADTQTGYYCRIIANILADRPDAFIILVNTWYNGSNQTETRTTIDAIGTKYSLPVVETVGVMPYSVNPIYHGNVDNVHCSKAGYLALANLIRSTIRDYIKAHPAVANKAMSQGT